MGDRIKYPLFQRAPQVTRCTPEKKKALFLCNQRVHWSSSYTESDFEDMFFGSSYTGTDSHPDGETTYGSVWAYYDRMSGGNLDITDSSVGSGPAGGVLNTVSADGVPTWIRLAGNKADYHLGTKRNFQTAALNAAAAAGIDTGATRTYRLVIIYAGNLYDSFYQNGSCGGDRFGCGLTPHARQGRNVYIMSEETDSDHTTYCRNHENCGQVFSHIGNHVHEIGHMFGLRHPHENPAGTADVRRWSVMQGGSVNGPNLGSSPIALSPEEMRDLGFANFTLLSGRRDALNVETGVYYQVDYGTGRFVIEHRNGGGPFNNYLERHLWNGSGLLLWYTDVTPGVDDTQNQDILEADGTNDDTGMMGDLFPGANNVTSFNDDTTPEPSDATGIAAGTTTHFALANIVNNGTSTTVDVFDNHYSDTPVVIDVNIAEARKQSVNFTWAAHADNPTHYIYYGTQPNTYGRLKIVSSGNTSDLLSSLANGTRFFAKINSSEEVSNIAHSCRSDYDNDGGTIDFSDFFLMADHANMAVTSDDLQRYDLSGNGFIDQDSDVTPFFTPDFGQDCSAIPKVVNSDILPPGKNSNAQPVVSTVTDEGRVDVDLKIAGATELRGYGFVIEYDTTIVSFLGASGSEGILQQRGDDAVIKLVKNEPGRLMVGAALTPGFENVDGSGLLSKVQFTAEISPSRTLPVSVSELVVADGDGNINHLYEARTDEGLTGEKNVPGGILFGASPKFTLVR